MYKKLFFTSLTPIIFILLGLSACVSAPPININEWSQGLTLRWLNIQQHQLVRLEKPAPAPQAIHIYLEGDGTPWVQRYFVARNPTPRYPLALELMKRDDQLGFYIGRPCYYLAPDFYHALAQYKMATPCNFHYWTDARYSETVVDVMSAALTETLQQLPSSQQTLPIILIGHSGGGTLALLIAQRVAEVDGVITIAANMDIHAWTQHQHYSPLKRSLNPATMLMRRNIPQVHFAGEHDEVVPPQINAAFMKKIGQDFIIKKNFDHNCCWLEVWPELLHQATERLNPKT